MAVSGSSGEDFEPTELELRDLDDNSTWASRNPDKPVIPVRNNYVKLTDAEKITAHARISQGHAKKLELGNDIRTFKANQAQALQEIAEKHGKTLKHVRDLATAETLFKPQRAVTLHNAKLHFLAEEVKMEEGKAPGLISLQERMKTDPDLHELSKEEEEALKQKLMQHKELNAKGARASHRAAAVDYERTLARMHIELGKLHERVGASLFLVGARNHINDTLPPTFIDAGDTAAFFLEQLDMTVNEFARRFQVWSDGRRAEKPKGTHLRNLQLECKCLIAEGLNRILNRKNVGMAYERILPDIEVRHKVRLIGWPENLTFTSPHKITTIPEVQRLRDALVSGACKWVKLTADEHAQAVEKLNVTPKKKRKTRSDKKVVDDAVTNADGSRGSADRGGPPRKRAKKSAASSNQIPPKSREIIPSDEESESGQE
ncbi:hypothetical protein DFP72DRAFT_861221 [Ephemerocybe angulata]|uniref:Uncharacterized protein n=1 Tax=Ephemerocybe angulata TaxID=980116 RepID=A0A8H6LV73_9AGAR|nr:hypothetical protein DFP72DRAFT_861221 [Tulosesus angulatus]